MIDLGPEDLEGLFLRLEGPDCTKLSPGAEL